MIHAVGKSTRAHAMALNIRNAETEALATRLAGLTGETKTEAVRRALEERLTRLQRQRGVRRRREELNEIALHCASLPLLDARDDDAILGYDADGMPTR